MTATSAAAPATPAAAAGLPAPPARIPWVGLLAVLLGTFISTLTGRLSSFGLADIRGGVHAGFDEGAWITTAATVAQMLVTPFAIWTGTFLGARKVLLFAATSFAVISLLTPFSPNLLVLLIFQFLGGLATGCFIPLTLSFVLRNTPPRFWAWGIALYALNLELSLNISASLEGWYVDNLTWRWIFWQNVPLALGMALCLHFGVARDKNLPKMPPPDVYGLISCGLGLALIYAALDQGNRLDWLNSGVVWGLLLAGLVILAGFLVHELRETHPWVDLKAAFKPPLPRLLVLIGFLRLTILSTAYLIPQFLGTVRGFRAIEVGQTLVWIAAPQLLFCPLAGLLLRRTDPRLVSSIGFITISVACLMVARGITNLWGSDQFLASQLLQSIGQSFALSGIVFFAVLHLRPEMAITFGAALQTARIMGGELGLAFVTTFLRVRSQTASNLIGLHVQGGDHLVMQRLQAYAGATGRATDPATATARGTAVLGNVVRSAAATQGIIDSFTLLAALTAVALMLAVAHRPAPIGPASHLPLFQRRPRTP
jgi:MFS transporter, DHA2 family, multidrug resistance protein